MFKKNKLSTLLISTIAILAFSGCSNEQISNEQLSSDNKSEITAVDQAKISSNAINKQRKTAADLPHYLERDVQEEVFYFVMPDRFNNGNTSNDLGSKTQPISAGGFDKTNKGMFHGGDIQGLKDKLPYLKSLGISSIWLTPILRNQAVQADSSGYHGYWVLDFTKIDPHLGSNEDLKALIDSAHAENIKIYFDIITNHTADVIKYVECHGEDGLQWLVSSDKGCPFKSAAQVEAGDKYTTVIPKGHEQLKTPAWLNDPKYYHNQGDSFWQGESSKRGDFSGLDDIDTNNPEVLKGLTDIFKNLITEFKPDGFRIDTVKHVNTDFWAKFSPALVEHAQGLGIKNFFMFGEVYSFTSKELSEYTTAGNMQSVLDFSFQSAMVQNLIEQKGTKVLAKLFANDIDYLDHDSNANQLMNFTGNHDMGRFAYMLKQSEFNYSEDQMIKRTLLAHAMTYFMRGVPIIYYGDEQGFVGDGGDQASRQDMMPSLVESYNDDDLLATDATTADDNFDINHPIYQSFAQYADTFYRYPALRRGEQQTVFQADNNPIFAVSRTMKNNELDKNANASNQTLLIAFNTSDKTAKANLELNGANYRLVAGKGNLMTKLKDKESLELPPLSFVIFEKI
jgi:glycosidase